MAEPLTAAEIAELRVEPDDKECGYYEIPCDQAARIFITLDARDAEIAALRAIVAVVANADNSDHGVCYQLCQYRLPWGPEEAEPTSDADQIAITHTAPCVVEQARALLEGKA